MCLGLGLEFPAVEQFAFQRCETGLQAAVALFRCRAIRRLIQEHARQCPVPGCEVMGFFSHSPPFPDFRFVFALCVEVLLRRADGYFAVAGLMLEKPVEHTTANIKGAMGGGMMEPWV
jgi:hypothetical protein